MSVEQVNQRVGIDEGVIHELQEQLQRVSAGHQTAHAALQSFQQMRISNTTEESERCTNQVSWARTVVASRESMQWGSCR